MSTDNCPLPEVAEALGPYIRTRNEVAAIRRGLHQHLQSQLRNGNTPLTSASLTIPPESQLGSPPSSLTGVRKAYWKALQAHGEAQARYDALRADLDRLKHQRSGPEAHSARHSTSVNDDYIPLLRLREKQRKLKAIETAYSEITSTGADLFVSPLDEIVKKQIGELSVPPNTHPSSDRTSEVEGKILELKKALVATKRRVDERKKQESLSTETNGASEVSPKSEIAGLQRALQELTTWMESQLTVIANAEGATQSPEDSGTAPDTKISSDTIETLYRQYVEARERLLRTVNGLPETQPNDSIEDLTGQNPVPRDTNALAKAPAELLLPYIPTLVAAKQAEQALMQQNAYVRRHISSAEAETDRLLRRLADESHLVQPGATSGSDWADAAKEASVATDNFIRERVEAGEAFANSTRQGLENIRSLPASLDRLI